MTVVSTPGGVALAGAALLTFAGTYAVIVLAVVLALVATASLLVTILAMLGGDGGHRDPAPDMRPGADIQGQSLCGTPVRAGGLITANLLRSATVPWLTPSARLPSSVRRQAAPANGAQPPLAG